MCKQCFGHLHCIPPLDELHRPDESAALWSVRASALLHKLTIAELITLQAKDKTLQPVCDFLINAVTPSVDELRSLPLESRKLWGQRFAIQLRDGLFVRVIDNISQLIVPSSLRRRLFLHTHTDSLAAHLGAQRTLAQLRQHYYWPGMSRDVSL